MSYNTFIMSGECRLPVVHSRSASQVSSSSTFSSQGDANEEPSQTITVAQIRRKCKVFGTPTRKAKRVRFFRNGDRFFKGVVMPVTPERYRSFDSLLSDVTHTLKDHVNLPNGVRNVYTLEGDKVSAVDDLEDGKCYVCSGQGEPFKRIEYVNLSSGKVKPCKTYGVLNSDEKSPATKSPVPDFIRPKVITLVRNGTRPRRIVKLLLNKRNARSFEHVLSSITEAVKLDTGAVRKVFTITGNQIFNLREFFDVENIFFVYGSERFSQDDFQLDTEENKAIQAQKKSLPHFRRQGEENVTPGAIPKMPLKRSLNQTNENREPELVVPSQIRLKYKIGKIIGDGNYAVVRRCTDRMKGVEYAMKIIDKLKWKDQVQLIKNEVEILRTINHPNIVKLLAEFDTPNEFYLIMELEGGDLFDAIAASTKFPEDESRLMIKHLSSALAYLHGRSIVHRDIKPENLLVRTDENMKVKSLKIGDFGLAQKVTEPLYVVCGSPSYVAPEILSETGYGLKVDIWAAGVILYILLCGFPPFVTTSNDQVELFDKILTGVFEFTSPYWDNISDSSKDLITNMLQGHPDVRFSAEDVLDHPWLCKSRETDELNNSIANKTPIVENSYSSPRMSKHSLNLDLSG